MKETETILYIKEPKSAEEIVLDAQRTKTIQAQIPQERPAFDQVPNFDSNIVGWVGQALMIGAYFANVSGKVSAESKRYLIANMAGCSAVAINTLDKGAYPTVGAMAFWAGISIHGYIKSRQQSRK